MEFKNTKEDGKPENVTLGQVKFLKSGLETNISCLIYEFEKQTGLKISSLDFEVIERPNDNFYSRLVKAKINNIFE